MARGIVTTHATKIFFKTLQFNVPVPESFCAKPMPTTAPTRQCDVDTGISRDDAASTATAPPICVANALDGLSTVIFVPTVLIVNRPMVTIPTQNPTLP